MNRRTTYMLAGSLLLALAIAALPQPSFAQSDPLIGLWQLNVAKSKTLGPPPKSQTVYFQGEAQNRKSTVVGITAAGNAQAFVFTEVVEDGKPHPVTGNPSVDAQAYTRVDARTVNVSRLKDGKVVQTMTWVVSPDGKMLTVTFAGTGVNGQVDNTYVFDRQ